jgi:hypothetical protein
MGGPPLVEYGSFLHDPDRPHLTPEQLAEELRRNPRSRVLVNCPLCHKDLPESIQVAVVVGNGWKQFQSPFTGTSDTPLASKAGGRLDVTDVQIGHVYYIPGPARVLLTSTGLFSAHLRDCQRRNGGLINVTHKAFAGGRPSA